jgi:hypothetical protein
MPCIAELCRGYPEKLGRTGVTRVTGVKRFTANPSIAKVAAKAMLGCATTELCFGSDLNFVKDYKALQSYVAWNFGFFQTLFEKFRVENWS